MTERVAEQIALGVSTRGYERSLEPVDPSIETRGALGSHPAPSSTRRPRSSRSPLRAKLDDVELIAMFIDGLEFGGHAVLVALGVTG